MPGAAIVVLGRHHVVSRQVVPAHPAELMHPGVNFRVPVGWGNVLFVASQSKRERVETSGLGRGHRVICSYRPFHTTKNLCVGHGYDPDNVH